jgi:3-keto-L-gulonate-6-phosphate decarboxylase
MGQNHLVQVAVDATTVERGLELIKLAVNAGADIVEAGTPFITYFGMKAIDYVYENAQGRKVLADFKTFDGAEKYAIEAASRGANMVTVMARAADGAIQASVSGARKAGIKVVADLCSVPLAEIGKRAGECERLGADYVMIHLGHDDAHANPYKHVLDGLDDVVKAVKVPIFVSTFTIEEALEALRKGATGIVQGEPILSQANALKQMTDFVKAVKAF